MGPVNHTYNDDVDAWVDQHLNWSHITTSHVLLVLNTFSAGGMNYIRAAQKIIIPHPC